MTYPSPPDEFPRLGGVMGIRRDVLPADRHPPVADLTDLGSQLFASIFRDKVRSLLAASLSSVAQEGAGLRLRLRFEEDAADLATLPWEILYDPDQDHFVGLGEASPILRYLSLPRSRSALLVEPPLRVLALLSSPVGLAPLDMEREWQAMQEALADTGELTASSCWSGWTAHPRRLAATAAGRAGAHPALRRPRRL